MKNYTQYYHLNSRNQAVYVTIDDLVKGMPKGTIVYYTHSQKAIAHIF